MTLRARTVVARRLRRDATDAEQTLWRALRERLPGWRFRRQHPIATRIADFACPSAKLAIELDGGQHAGQPCRDAARTEELARHGYRVIRFWNNEVLENTEGVLAAIAAALDDAKQSPSPPFRAEKDLG
jgi:very-short-patch-repair endonuclease